VKQPLTSHSQASALASYNSRPRPDNRDQGQDWGQATQGRASRIWPRDRGQASRPNILAVVAVEKLRGPSLLVLIHQTNGAPHTTAAKMASKKPRFLGF